MADRTYRDPPQKTAHPDPLAATPVEGEAVFVGDFRADLDLPDGTPCVVIATTREALKAGPPLVYRRVRLEVLP